MSVWQRLNPQLLHYFLAVSRTGSLSAAARQLHCVPSNVSARLRQLEQQLGTPLFQRQARQLGLTLAGERLLPHAQQLEQLCQRAWHSVHQDVWAGTLRLGSMETCAAVRLPELLADFHRHAPQISLNLITGTSRWLLGEVLEERLDAALIGGPYEHPQLCVEVIWRERLELVIPKGYRLEQVLATPLTLLGFPAGCHYRERLERWAERQAAPVAVRQSYGSVETIFASVAAGMGVGLLPASLKERHPRSALVDWLPIDRDLAQTPTLLVHRKDLPPNPALEPLLSLLRQQVLNTDGSPFLHTDTE